ncbi:ParA family protein [Microbacterium thalli]|uniref:ParA family protein n=1 Tax=Microbacterium thalli TaxID=3027921 RepID=A0ABT5SF17_9MICO|nr:ParA family protein [Microbacterium thalli]MDD7961409.1 ParA family protein [Microbacterium thalli]
MSTIISHPRAYATVTGTHVTFVTLDGLAEPIHAFADEDVRHAIVRRATDEARRSGATLELVTSGDRGDHRLLVTPDGALTHIESPTPAPDSPGDQPLRTESYGEEVSEQAPQPTATDTAEAPAAESPARPSFLSPAPEPLPRPTGWRGFARHLGISVKPSAGERRRAEWTAVVSRQWAGCRTIAIANGKGGVGKTMTTAMLSAVYAREGGGNVLAWDNNDTRGTLGWRTEQGMYDTTLRDLLPEASRLLELGAGVSDITRFVHHQATDRYDVLRSNPELLANDQRIASAEFDLLTQVAARFYRLVIFDSGNDESAERWLRMVDNSYQLVIPTLATPESAESAALLLDALRERDERSSILAARAVVIVTQSEPAPAVARQIADGFRDHVRAVHIIPFDPALKAGALRFDDLRPRTRDAWFAAAAATAEGL